MAPCGGRQHQRPRAPHLVSPRPLRLAAPRTHLHPRPKNNPDAKLATLPPAHDKRQPVPARVRLVGAGLGLERRKKGGRGRLAEKAKGEEGEEKAREEAAQGGGVEAFTGGWWGAKACVRMSPSGGQRGERLKHTHWSRYPQ